MHIPYAGRTWSSPVVKWTFVALMAISVALQFGVSIFYQPIQSELIAETGEWVRQSEAHPFKANPEPEHLRQTRIQAEKAQAAKGYLIFSSFTICGIAVIIGAIDLRRSF